MAGTGQAQSTRDATDPRRIYLACPTVKMEKHVATGDGATKDFDIGDSYEAGYLEVFINGIKQAITTHYTEGNADLGTFTMNQAPATGDSIDVIYAKLCSAGMTPVKPTPYTPPGVANGPGKRVYLVGHKTSGAPFFVWTENIYATPIVWQENSTGLPTAIDAGNNISLHIDPYHPSTAGWIVLDNAADSEGHSLWRNTSLRGGGTWTNIFDLADWNADTGRSDTSIAIRGRYENIPGMATTIATAGFVAWVVQSAPTVIVRVIHSHDYGVTRTYGTPPTNAVHRGIALGQHNSNKVYLSQSGVFVRSADGGHTFTTASPGVGGGGPMNGTADHLIVPYNGNASDIIVMAFKRVSTGLYRSADSGDNWLLVSNPASLGNYEIAGDGAPNVGVMYSGDDSLITMDGGTTWTTLNLTMGLSPANLALLTLGYYYVCGVDDGAEVFTSTDWKTFTLRLGNLHTLLGANPDCYTIVPDWTT